MSSVLAGACVVISILALFISCVCFHLCRLMAISIGDFKKRIKAILCNPDSETTAEDIRDLLKKH